MSLSNKIKRYAEISAKIVDVIKDDDEVALRFYDRQGEEILRQILQDNPASVEEAAQLLELLLELLSPPSQRGKLQEDIIGKIRSMVTQVYEAG